jgi:hypothetical protein
LTDSLRALLSNLIDYAGLYPPAALPLEKVLAHYGSYRDSPDRWMLGRLVLPAAKLADAPLEDGWRITLLADSDPGPLPQQVETIETKQPFRAPLPSYAEIPLDRIDGTFAKIRTGGITPDAIPGSHHIAEFLHVTASRRIPFKATAGLHHPIRAEYALTYAPDAPRAVMHGFLNVFAAACFAWIEAPAFLLEEILEERDPHAFEFHDHGMLWRGRPVSTGQIRAARLEFAHSFGSCSFEEPVAGLRELGLLS